MHEQGVDAASNVELWTNLAKDPNLPREYRSRIPFWTRFLPSWMICAGIKNDHRKTLKPVVQIPCVLKTLSQVVTEEGINQIDLLKIDAEGSEWDVLHGIHAADWPKVMAVVVEVHDAEGRLASIERMPTENGIANITVSQDYAFPGTSLYNVYAKRRSA